VQKNARLVDTSQRPAYLLVMVQQWLNLVLGLVVMMTATILTALAVQLQSSTGFTGASLITLMAFGENLTGLIVWYTRLETSLGAIARISTFTKTVKPEDQENETLVPPEHWPSSGVIELNGISASYE
jgi:ABC-type multidrug transport system fused ATPase/permease subunit